MGISTVQIVLLVILDVSLEWEACLIPSIKIYETQNKTGNKVLDTILTSKSMHCQRHGIELKFMG